MKMFPTVLALLLAISGVQSTAAAQNIEKTLIRSNNKDRACYIFVPEKFDAANPVPLIVLLHGSGRNGMSQAEKWRDLAKKEKFIIAAPDSTDLAGWQVPADGPDYIREVVDFMNTKYPIDKRRVYLFGHSAGAIMALNLSLFESEYFAGAVAHAGTLSGQMNSMVSRAKRKIPIYIIVGTDDNLFPLEAVRATRDVLVKGGFNVALTEIKGHTHDYYGMSKEINDQAWAFLKPLKLAADPVYETYQFK